MRTHVLTVLVVFVGCGLAAPHVAAQSSRPTSVTIGQPAATPESAFVGITPPADYVIGPDDVLTFVVYGEKELTGDVLVRPDGKVTLTLINEV